MEDPPNPAETLAFIPSARPPAPIRGRPETSALLLVDAQERLVPAIDGRQAVISAMARLLRAADLLGVPVRATEHCPEAIGPTVPALAGLLGTNRILAKRHFDGLAEPDLSRAVADLRRPVLVVAGIEAHVCLAQTALGLRAQGYSVLVAEDACGSRRPLDRDTGLARLRSAGCVPVTVEAMIFEWLGSADHPAFRDALNIIKEV